MRVLRDSDVERLLSARIALDATRRCFESLAERRWHPIHAARVGGADSQLSEDWSSNEEGWALQRLESPSGKAAVALHLPPRLFLGLLDAAAIRRLRPGSASALATQILSREDSGTLAVFGTGVQARLHVHRIMAVRNIKRVLIVGRTSMKAQAFVAQIARELGGGMRFEAADAGRAASLADIICLCTDSPTPVLLGNEVQKGCHINAIGAMTFDSREVDTNTVLRSKVVIEDKGYGVTNAGDLRIPCEEGRIGIETFQTDLGDIATGRKAVRTSPEDITLFKSAGHPAMDFYLALAAYEAAVEQRVGAEVEFLIG